MHKACLHISAC